MKFSYLAIIKINFPEAHFWLIRRGAVDRCGEPVREFDIEYIGIKVIDTQIILPDYLYYMLKKIHFSGYWKIIATGSTNLVNIKVSDVKNLKLS